MKLFFLCLIFAVVHGGFGKDVKEGDFLFDFIKDDDGSKINESSSPQTRQRRAVSLDKFINGFTKLQEKFKLIPDKHMPKLQFVLKKLNSTVANLTSDENVDKLHKVADSLQKNWDTLTGADSGEIAKSVCEIVGSVGSLVPPPVGTVISTLMGLVSGILGMGGGPKQKTMGEIVQEVVEKELKKQYRLEMKGKIQGAIEALELNQVFLNGYTGGNLTPKDYTFMVTQFGFLTHMELRGSLAHFIETQSIAKDKDGVLETVGLINSYVTVTSMLEILMHTMKSILEEDTETQKSAENLGQTIETARGQSRRHLQFLRNPKLENAMMIAFYEPAKQPKIEAFLDSLEISSSADSLHQNGCYILKNRQIGLDVTIDKVKSPRLAGKDGTDRFSALVKFGFVKSGNTWNIMGPKGPVCAAVNGQFLEIKGCRSESASFRIYGFTEGGYMIINEQQAINPLWMKQDQEMLGMGLYGIEFIPLFIVSAEEKTWDKDNPEYIWDISSVPCK